MFAALDRLKTRAHSERLELGVARTIQKQAKPIEVQREEGSTISMFTPERLL